MMETEKKILIIDPDDNERHVTAFYLKSLGFLVDTGRGLVDAIKKMKENSFACIAIDVDLPEMKGYEAVSILKTIDPDIRIIMTTKKNSKQLEAKVREQDIFFYFIKSFDKEELKFAISDTFKNIGGNDG